MRKGPRLKNWTGIKTCNQCKKFLKSNMDQNLVSETFYKKFLTITICMYGGIIYVKNTQLLAKHDDIWEAHRRAKGKYHWTLEAASLAERPKAGLFSQTVAFLGNLGPSCPPAMSAEAQGRETHASKIVDFDSGVRKSCCSRTKVFMRVIEQKCYQLRVDIHLLFKFPRCLTILISFHFRTLVCEARKM